MNYGHLCSVSFTPQKAPPSPNPITPTWSHIHPLTFSLHTHKPHHTEHTTTQMHKHTRLWVIKQQAGCQFGLNVTFKVLFSLYIQYTSQKYTVILQ